MAVINSRKFFYYSISFALFFAVGLILTKGIIKNSFQHIVAAELHKTILYPVQFGEFRGNFLTGVQADNLLICNDPIKGQSREILRADRILVNYSLLNLLLSGKKKKINISLINPMIYIEHYSDNSFNVLKMIRPLPQQKKRKIHL